MAGDAKYQQVALLLHMDGSNGSTVFADSSPRQKSPVTVGDTVISEAQSKFNGASGLFNSGHISVPHHADLVVGSSDFCIEFWVHPTSMTGNAILFNKQAGTTSGYPYQALLASDGALTFRSFDSASVKVFSATTSAGAVQLNAWAHLAFCRRGSTFTVYVNGVALATGTYSGSLPGNTENMQIGAYSTSTYPIKGYIDEFRFTNGDSRYSANFTVESGQFFDFAGQVSGLVRDDTDTPTSRIVRAYRRDTGALIGDAISNVVSGAYVINCQALDECYVVFLDDSGGVIYNDKILRAMPA